MQITGYTLSKFACKNTAYLNKFSTPISSATRSESRKTGVFAVRSKHWMHVWGTHLVETIFYFGLGWRPFVREQLKQVHSLLLFTIIALVSGLRWTNQWNKHICILLISNPKVVRSTDCYDARVVWSTGYFTYCLGAKKTHKFIRRVNMKNVRI